MIVATAFVALLFALAAHVAIRSSIALGRVS